MTWLLYNAKNKKMPQKKATNAPATIRYLSPDRVKPPPGMLRVIFRKPPEWLKRDAYVLIEIGKNEHAGLVRIVASDDSNKSNHVVRSTAPGPKGCPMLFLPFPKDIATPEPGTE